MVPKFLSFFSTAALLLALAACAPDAPKLSSQARESGPKDDCDVILLKYGPPEADESTDRDVPRPVIPTRFITYRKEHVRWLYVPDWAMKNGLTDAEMAPPPYRWKLVGATDPRTQRPISADLAVKRLALRELSTIVKNFRKREKQRAPASR